MLAMMAISLDTSRSMLTARISVYLSSVMFLACESLSFEMVGAYAKNIRDSTLGRYMVGVLAMGIWSTIRTTKPLRPLATAPTPHPATSLYRVVFTPIAVPQDLRETVSTERHAFTLGRTFGKAFGRRHATIGRTTPGSCLAAWHWQYPSALPFILIGPGFGTHGGCFSRCALCSWSQEVQSSGWERAFGMPCSLRRCVPES